MTHFAVFDGFGELLTIIEANTKHQLRFAIDDFADEYIEGCSLQREITERDWQALVAASPNISVLFDIPGGYVLEVKGVTIRSHTHYPPEEQNNDTE